MKFVTTDKSTFCVINLHLYTPFCRLKSSASVPTSDTTIWDPPLEVAPATTGSDQNQAKEPFDFQPQLQFPKNLKDLKVRVTHVNSPSSFYVQFAQNDPQLKRSESKQQCFFPELGSFHWLLQIAMFLPSINLPEMTTLDLRMKQPSWKTKVLVQRLKSFPGCVSFWRGTSGHLQSQKMWCGRRTCYVLLTTMVSGREGRSALMSPAKLQRYFCSQWVCAPALSFDFHSMLGQVMRCDYGNKLELPVSKLRRLPSSLIGAFALECTLIDIRLHTSAEI